MGCGLGLGLDNSGLGLGLGLFSLDSDLLTSAGLGLGLGLESCGLGLGHCWTRYKSDPWFIILGVLQFSSICKRPPTRVMYMYIHSTTPVIITVTYIQ